MEPPRRKEAPMGKEGDKGKGESQERTGSGGQEPMQLTQVEAPPVRERAEKPWAGEGKQIGGDEESVTTSPTIVVDLSNTSFEEGGAAATHGGDGSGHDSELSDEDGNGEEETDPAKKAKARKAAMNKASRLKRKDAARELATREQGDGVEVDTSKALAATSTGKKPAAATARIEKKKPATIEREEAEFGTDDKRPKGGA
jgi:hypothetical protein